MDWFRKKSLARGDGAGLQPDKDAGVNYGSRNPLAVPAPNVIVTGTNANGERFVDGQYLG